MTSYRYAILLFALCQSFSFGQTEQVAPTSLHFVEKVLPVLKSKCFACHGEDHSNLKGELDLTTLTAMLSGGESGEAIVPGDANKSLIVEAIRWDGLEMPPKENDRLTTKQIAAVEKWINDGAVWPAAKELERIKQSLNQTPTSGDEVVVKTSGGLSDDWTFRRYNKQDLWAIQPLLKPGQPKNGFSIDSYVNRQLAAAKIDAAPLATARQLIRRAKYDLTGLPPTPSEIAEFEIRYRADADVAWEELIDELLSSQHYGERWGQHWLDVVRYADTAGFSNDFELSNAWRYRDYVIRAFNSDLPYDQFVIQQLAGDELFEEQKVSTEPIPLGKAEATIATGFLRMGPWEHTAMSPPKVSRQNYIDDLVNSVGQTFLSTALRCCKCHDHKYDPVPTRDYYRIYAALSTTQPAEMPAEFLESENRRLFESQKKHCDTLLNYAQDQARSLQNQRETAARKWYDDRGMINEYRPWLERKKLDYNQPKPPRNIGLSPEEEGRLKVREQDVRIWTRRLNRFQPLAQGVYSGPDSTRRSDNLEPPKNFEFDESPEESFILTGGDVFSPDQAVTAGVLSCVGIPTSTRTPEDDFALPGEFKNRRLELARWIVDPKNGLAVRSIVNRIWHYHFGKGLAANPNNFGATGARPTHPELLDWLACEFVDNGWSIKTLHKTIMLSETYRRSTDHPDLESLASTDPDNQLLSYFNPRRLTAEEIRDTMLSASGELNSEVGGLPIRPEINLEVALAPRMIQFSLAPAYQPERKANDRNRRSIYAYRVRGLQNPLLDVLDKPNPNESCELRDSASTAPQAFALLNGDGITKRSLAMARRLRSDHSSLAKQIERGFELVTGSTLDAVLLAKLQEHYQKMLVYHQSTTPNRANYPTTITRSLIEENTGEKFEYVEMLDIYENYETDFEANDVNAATRALADVCLLFFNSNQMMYVY